MRHQYQTSGRYTHALEEEEQMTDAYNINKEIRRGLSVLNAREQDIIKRRFGIDYPRCYTLLEIASHYSLSWQRIRQIELRALEKMAETGCLKDY